MDKSLMTMRIFLFFLLLFIPFCTSAQISKGGMPQARTFTARSVETGDVPQTVTKSVQPEEPDNPHSPFVFAHKFSVNVDPFSDGEWQEAENGDRIWYLSIKSKGAYSINLLFEEFHIPKGATMFLYNPALSDCKGAFTSENNASHGLLPTAPVDGDELIVEYVEPADASFRGSFRITEVNHDYIGILRANRPGVPSNESCQPNVACYENWKREAQSVGVFIVNGMATCSGALINNTANDGTPYFLTAAHCFETRLTSGDLSYEVLAERTVVFFNYQSPSCDRNIRGPEEMSIASTQFVAGSRDLDFLLLKLSTTPPPHYRPYYMGWNRGLHAPPYSGIHQPSLGIKKLNLTQGSLSDYSPRVSEIGYPTIRNAYNYVSKWDVGITERGSSGSPLFDVQGRCIGGLTGGASYCSNRGDDFYFKLQTSWDYYDEPSKQLKHWLDPMESQSTVCDGLDPYEATGTKADRVSPITPQTAVELALVKGEASGYAFGYNSAKPQEYAAAFENKEPRLLHGVHLVTSQWKSDYNNRITVRIYSGDDTPGTLLGITTAYLSYQTYDGKDIELSTTTDTDSYLHFDKPIRVDGKFFVAYSLDYTESMTNGFSLFNTVDTAPEGNTWVKMNNRWQNSASYPYFNRTTSLWIDPVVSKAGSVSVEEQPDIRQAISFTTNGIHPYELTIRSAIDNAPAEMTLYSTSGLLLHHRMVPAGVSSVPLPSLPHGIYVVRITSAGNTCTGKVLF